MFAWVQKSAEHGNAHGEAGMGYAYWYGRGVAPDPSTSLFWYRKAAEQGNAHGEAALGIFYEKGAGVPQSDAEAVFWYRKSAEQGDGSAEYNLARMYRYGRGVPRDWRHANRLMRSSADQGYPPALKTTTRHLAFLPKVGLVLLALIGWWLIADYLPLGRSMPGKLPHTANDKILLGGGVLALASVAFDWYGYTHAKFRSLQYGLSAWLVVHWLFLLLLGTWLVNAVHMGKIR